MGSSSDQCKVIYASNIISEIIAIDLKNREIGQSLTTILSVDYDMGSDPCGWSFPFSNFDQSRQMSIQKEHHAT